MLLAFYNDPTILTYLLEREKIMGLHFFCEIKSPPTTSPVSQLTTGTHSPREHYLGVRTLTSSTIQSWLCVLSLLDNKIDGDYSASKAACSNQNSAMITGGNTSCKITADVHDGEFRSTLSSAAILATAESLNFPSLPLLHNHLVGY